MPNEGETSPARASWAPSTATAEAGAELFGALVDALAGLLAAVRVETDPDL
jgi:creatinine amidohydrolase/Fe(II)-dependent formamide hydrolase-like protein